MSYLISFSERDLDLVIQALEFFSRQTMMFGQQAEWAGMMTTELEATKKRQDAA
jgi:hypothetical protein